MAVTKRFRPRRGKASTLRTKNPVLLAGELIVEVPDAGVGKGAVKMKMGDGTTAYNSLPYAVSPQTNAGDHTITFTTSATTANATLLNEIASGKTLKSIIGSTKKLLSNFNTSISDLTTKYNSFNDAKSKIISSGLGSALGMTSTTTIADVANKIAAVVNRGAVSGSITTSGGTYTIAAGYHNGSGKVTGPTLATLVGSNVTLDNAANLLSNVTAYGKNGTKYTGSHTCPTLGSLVGSNVNLANGDCLLSGITAYGRNGVKYSGSLVNRDLVDANTGGINASYPTVATHQGSLLQMGSTTKDNVSRISIQVPNGVYRYGSYVNMPSSSFGTAATGNVLSGATFTSTAGIKVSGTMVSHIGKPQHIDAIRIANNRFEVAVAAGFHGYSWAGNSYEYMEFSQVASAIGLTAAKLVSGNTVCGVAGSHTCASLATLVGSNVTLDNAANLLSGVTAYGKNGTKYTGTNQGYTAGYNAGVAAGKSSGTVTFIGSEKFSKWNGASSRTYTVPSGVGTVYIFAYGCGGGLTGQSSASVTVTVTAGTATTLIESKSGSGSYPNTLVGYKYTGCAGATITVKIKTGNGTGQINGGAIVFYLS